MTWTWHPPSVYCFITLLPQPQWNRHICRWRWWKRWWRWRRRRWRWWPWWWLCQWWQHCNTVTLIQYYCHVVSAPWQAPLGAWQMHSRWHFPANGQHLFQWWMSLVSQQIFTEYLLSSVIVCVGHTKTSISFPFRIAFLARVRYLTNGPQTVVTTL